MRVYLRDSNELTSTIRRTMRDVSNARWSESELYDAINESLSEWAGRVSFPCTYSLGTLTDTTYYALPYYIKGDVTPQFLDQATYNASTETVTLTGDEVWKRLPLYDIDYNDSGTLSVEVPGNSYYTSARVVYWVLNGPLPRPDNTVSTDWASDDTSLVVAMSDSPQSVPEVGYVHVNREWIFYAGTSYGSGTVTLQNTVRAQDNTTAAAHTTGDYVYWGIAIHDLRLLSLLQTQVRYKLHSMFLTDASPHEDEKHTWLRRDGIQQVNDFWRTYVPMKIPRRHLTTESYIRTRRRTGRVYAYSS